MGQWEASAGASDEWYTPAYIFEALGERFDLDVAAPRRCFVPARMSLCSNGLTSPWWGFVWMNPPFGGRTTSPENGIWPWLTKFFEHGNGIALTPDRTSAPWFRDAWDRAELALFMPKVRFLDGRTGKFGGSPSNGTCLWATGNRASIALERAASVGLGILAQPKRIAA